MMLGGDIVPGSTGCAGDDSDSCTSTISLIPVDSGFCALSAVNVHNVSNAGRRAVCEVTMDFANGVSTWYLTARVEGNEDVSANCAAVCWQFSRP